MKYTDLCVQNVLDRTQSSALSEGKSGAFYGSWVWRMNKHHRVTANRFLSAVEVKSKFGAEFRRFSLERSKPGCFEEFYGLLQHVHRIPNTDLLVGYTDVQGDLLPINNDDNYRKAISGASPLLRIFLLKREEADFSAFGTESSPRKKRVLDAVLHRGDRVRRRPGVTIGPPRDFRPVSSVIDADILPASLRRVRLHKHGQERPLGFYIRDGTTMRVTSNGLQKVPAVFISRVVPGGLAASTGLLAVDDEVLEVNGIEVVGKALDQVTDMMVANSHNLVITVRPTDQRNNVLRPSGSSEYPLEGFRDSRPEEPESDEEDEDEDEEDLVMEAGGEARPIPSSASPPRYRLHLGLSSSTGSLNGPERRNELESPSPEEEGTVITL